MKRSAKGPGPIKPRSGFVVRAMTYNIHGCLDAAREVRPETIADIIAGFDADIVALQEVDAEKPIRRNRNQAKTIADRIHMDYRFFPVENNGRHTFGLAVLSRFPFKECYCDWLPNFKAMLSPRKRGAIRATLQTPGGKIQFFNTHLSVYEIERRRQLQALLSESWHLSDGEDRPVILCGDFNAGALSKTYRRLAWRLTDVQRASPEPRLPKPTFHARSPFLRLDHIFVSKHFRPLKAEVKRTRATIAASDHLPLVADLWLKRASAPHAKRPAARPDRTMRESNC